MTEPICFNCLKPGHKSINCPEPQKKTRCPSCDKVDGHTVDCRNPLFKSQSSFQSTTVFEMTSQLKLEFQQVTDKFTVIDVRREVDIGMVPLWLSTIDAHVGKSGDRSLKFATSRPMKRHVTFVNKNGVPVLSLVFYSKVLTVNDRFSINEKGIISFDGNARNTINERVVCKIRVNNVEDTFKVRVSWYDNKFVFNVHPRIGPILVDSQAPIVTARPNEGNINVRINAIFQNDRIDESAGAYTIAQDEASERTFTVNLDLQGMDRMDNAGFKVLLKDWVELLPRPLIAAVDNNKRLAITDNNERPDTADENERPANADENERPAEDDDNKR